MKLSPGSKGKKKNQRGDINKEPKNQSDFLGEGRKINVKKE